MRKLLSILSCVSLLFLYAACTPYYYIPRKQNVMEFKKRGDFVAGVGMSAFSGMSAEEVYLLKGGNIESGYAFTNYLALHSSLSNYNISLRDRSFPHDLFWENEMILFHSFPNKVYSSLNVGFGWGGFCVTNQYYKLNLYQPFVVPAIGYSFNSTYDLALSAKFSEVSYRLSDKMNLIDSYDKQMFQDYFNFPDFAKSTSLIEPAISLGINTDYAKVILQYAWLHPLEPNNLKGLNGNITVSFQMNLRTIFPFKHKKSATH